MTSLRNGTYYISVGLSPPGYLQVDADGNAPVVRRFTGTPFQQVEGINIALAFPISNTFFYRHIVATCPEKFLYIQHTQYSVPELRLHVRSGGIQWNTSYFQHDGSNLVFQIGWRLLHVNLPCFYRFDIDSDCDLYAICRISHCSCLRNGWKVDLLDSVPVSSPNLHFGFCRAELVRLWLHSNLRIRENCGTSPQWSRWCRPLRLKALPVSVLLPLLRVHFRQVQHPIRFQWSLGWVLGLAFL